MTPERETEIIQEIKDGNYLLFTDIIDTYEKRLMAFVHRLIKDADEAKDICQETFLKVYKSIRSFRGKSKFSTWLFQIGYHNCLDFIKRNSRMIQREVETLEKSSPSLKSPSNELEMREIGSLINVIVQEIPGKYSTAMHLFFKEEKSYKEIGFIMHTGINNVKSYIHRGKELVKKELMEKYGIHQCHVGGDHE
jgi:RNA polymerase sigma factor (sigma-70 family)